MDIKLFLIVVVAQAVLAVQPFCLTIHWNRKQQKRLREFTNYSLQAKYQVMENEATLKLLVVLGTVTGGFSAIVILLYLLPFIIDVLMPHRALFLVSVEGLASTGMIIACASISAGFYPIREHFLQMYKMAKRGKVSISKKANVNSLHSRYGREIAMGASGEAYFSQLTEMWDTQLHRIPGNEPLRA